MTEYPLKRAAGALVVPNIFSELFLFQGLCSDGASACLDWRPG